MRLRAPRVRAGVTNFVWFWRLLQCIREFEAVFPPVNSTFKPSIRIKAGVAVADIKEAEISKKIIHKKFARKLNFYELLGLFALPGQRLPRHFTARSAFPTDAV